MPVIDIRIERDRSGWIGIVRLVEQQQVHAGAAFREDAEIFALSAGRR
jgi:hypothetical protein